VGATERNQPQRLAELRQELREREGALAGVVRGVVSPPTWRAWSSRCCNATARSPW